MINSPRYQEYRMQRMSPLTSGQPLHQPIVLPDNRDNLRDPEAEVYRRPFRK